jgi:hypothetical protein
VDEELIPRGTDRGCRHHRDRDPWSGPVHDHARVWQHDGASEISPQCEGAERHEFDTCRPERCHRHGAARRIGPLDEPPDRQTSAARE